jgi:hypothetical protein
MKNLLIVTFDLLRAGETAPSLAAASILSYLRSQPEYGTEFLADFRSINLLGRQALSNDELFEASLRHVDFTVYTHVAIGAYIWGENRTNPLMEWIRTQGFAGEFVLGGYQISYTTRNEEISIANLRRNYPDARRFVRGYAEASLKRLLIGSDDAWLFEDPVEFGDLVSPYVSGVIHLDYEQPMVRTETMRGCPYRCSFCAHRDTANNRVHQLRMKRIEKEFALFAERRVGKVNILDPVFNGGRRALEILGLARNAGLNSLLSLQCRFEQLTEEFINAVAGMNVELEFGAQTLNPREAEIINRPNDLKKIDWALRELASRGVAHEVSLIYGLPGQTVDTFRASIDWLQSRGVGRIKAWPLMLLRGTELDCQREEFNMRETQLGDYGIPVVTSSSSFTENEWNVMREIAEALCPTERV